MGQPLPFTINPELDLVLDRFLDVPPSLVWEAWTKPEHLVHWFTPDPWKTVACEIDLRPGGAFQTTMRSPEGVDHPSEGCFLEVIPNERLVWTDALCRGYRPNPKSFMTAAVVLSPEGSGTRYTAYAIHSDAATKNQHEEMGFHDGWGKAVEQLVAYVKTLPR